MNAKRVRISAREKAKREAKKLAAACDWPECFKPGVGIIAGCGRFCSDHMERADAAALRA